MAAACQTLPTKMGGTVKSQQAPSLCPCSPIGLFVSCPPAQVHIFMIANINRHRPQFLRDHYEVTVPQDTLPGVELLQVQASDQDNGKGLIYTIHSSQDPGSASLFQLDPSSGVLVTVGRLDLLSWPSRHILMVMVSKIRMDEK